MTATTTPTYTEAGTSMLQRLADAFTALVFPYRCQECGILFRPPGRDHNEEAGGAGAVKEEGLSAVFRHVFSRHLCLSCRDDFQPAASPICTCCGLVFRSRQGEDHLCGDCLSAPKHFDAARAFGIYDGALMALIHQFKYRGKTQLAAGLGRLVYAAFSRYFADRPPDLIIPVPLHRRRFRKRGFNQAYLLVRDWAAGGNPGRAYPVAAPVDCRALRRRRATRPQTTLGRKQRLTNIRHAFAMDGAADVDGMRVLLVDDVLTTGATVDEAARVLRAAGAAGVDVLTLARGM